jgi:hypothetical protein
LRVIHDVNLNVLCKESIRIIRTMNPPFGGGAHFFWKERNMPGGNIGGLDQLVPQGQNRGLGAVINS